MFYFNFYIILTSVMVLAIISSASVDKKKKVHIDFHVCHKSNSDFNNCFKDEVQRAIPLLKGGYPKLGIPPMDPFHLDSLSIAKGNGPISLDLNLLNIKVHGLATMYLSNLSLDPVKLTGSIKCTFSKPINLIGSYVANGKLQVFPINGAGPCNITLVNPVMEVTNINAHTVDNNGVKHIIINEVSMKITKMSQVIFKMDNIFKGNRDLSEHLNVFLNENWNLLYDELKPAFEEASIAIFKDLLQKAVSKFSLDDIFPQ